jgi:type I restriction enzyme R subunit
MDEETRQEFEWLFGKEDEILVDPSALERKFTIPERNRAIVREYRKVLEEGFTGSDGVKRFPLHGRAIVFAVNKRHAETLAAMFDNEFADKKPRPEVRYADFVVSGCGPEDTADAFTKIDRFKKEQFPQILVSVNMLDTGFDAPEVVHLVMARFTKSSILYQQMRGRGTRRADHIKKTGFTIFDFVGVTDYHRDDEAQPEGGAVFVSAPSKVTEGGKRKLLVLDVHDHIDPTTREWVTLDEDGNPVPNDARTAHIGELLVHFEEWLSGQDFNSDQLRLLRLVKNQVEANPEMEGFDIYRFTQPPFSFNGGIQRARQLFGGDEGLRAMIGSLNASVFPAGEDTSEPEQPTAMQ